MNRLHTELHRLYLSPSPPSDEQATENTAFRLTDADGRVRTMVLEVSKAADWNRVAALWQGVQDELGLPAPAIAVSGGNGYQLWFSLTEPIPAVQAHSFLESLRQRYLGDVASRHISIMPLVDDAESLKLRHARLVPEQQEETGHWSAFVAPGLASMFADEPWLEMQPNFDAQATLLSGFESIKPAVFLQAQKLLLPPRAPTEAATHVPDSGHHRPGTAQTPIPGASDPQRFLLAVMNDPNTELGLRIEAAKALLPYLT